MSNKPVPAKIHFTSALIVLIVLGLAVHLLVPQITSLEHSWSVIKGMTWWAVILAVAAQVLSYLASGFMLQAIVNINHQNISVLKGALITIASTSFGMVAGGWLGGAAATYTWLRRENQTGNSSVLAGTLPSLLNNVVLVGIALIGTLFLLLLHDLSKLQLIEFSVISLLLVALSASVVIAVRFPEKATRFAVWLSGHWSSLRRKQFDPEKTETSVKQIFLALESFRNGKWLLPMLGATGSILFDILTLYFMFVAAGHNVSPTILFAGYGLPLLLGKMAFLLPGGVGVVEGSMVALYTSLKVPNAISVVVILGYRMISFWLPTLLGFLAAAYLSRKTPNSKEERQAAT